MATPHLLCGPIRTVLAVFIFSGNFVFSPWAWGQAFEISNAQLLGANQAAIQYQSQPNAQFILLQGRSVLTVTTPVATNSGSAGPGQFLWPLAANEPAVFFQIRRELNGPALLPPSLAPPPTATRDSSVALSGTAAPNAALRVDVDGGTAAFGAAGTDGTFSINVALQGNKLNRLFVTATDNSGNSSAAKPIQVLQDSQPPSLFLDFPADHQELSTDKVVIAGRVGDLLSGSMGLDVRLISSPSEGPAPQPDPVPASANWPAANVIVGIGNNGTFERGNVPLALGKNIITAVATDVLGNSVARQIALTRVSVSGAQMFALSGDRQIASVHRPLAQPIVVKVTRDDGATPLPNKIVTFEVIRSDGRLRPASQGDPTQPAANTPATTLQVLTDGAGLATAFWTLGGDAGCGNNRVSVTSRDIAGTVFFCASANPAGASQINVGSGNDQRVEAGAQAHEPLNAWVNDSCNGVSAIAVTFTVVRGGGQLRDLTNPAPAGSSSLTVLSSITGHASVEFQVGPEPGSNVIEATYPDNPGASAIFNLTGVARNPSQVTSFSGLILDNTSKPIGGAQCLLTVAGSNFFTESGDDGRFLFQGVPAGPARLQVNGLEATSLNGTPILPGSYPALTFSPVLIANAANTLPKPVLLPKLNPNNAQSYDGTKDVVLTCQGVAGLKMIVKAGSMRRVDGSVPSPRDPATLALNPVHTDSVPMPIPDGAAPQFTWTLQPGGSTFDPPVQIEYPNMSGLPAGTVTFFLSFNHDTEKFEIIASGHVTADGSTIVTDPGVGLKVAGWGCNCPPYSVTGTCTNGFPRTVVKDTNNPPPPNCTTNCTDSGKLMVGTVDKADQKACPRQPLMFIAPAVSDTGGTMTLVCQNADGSTTRTTIPIPPAAVAYQWTVYRDNSAFASGTGNTATVVPPIQGTYVCMFTASAQRACPPASIDLPVQTATVIRIDLSMQNLLEENENNSNLPNEINPGAILFVNDNDNDGLDGIDKDATSLPLPQDDPDLEPFFIQMLPNPGEGTVTLTVPAGTKVWKDRRKNPTPLSWNLSADTLPPLLYIEGLQIGAGNLVATYTDSIRCQDTVRVNVVKAMLLLGAENDQDTALNDDWVGANGHRILNYVTVTGPPKLTVPLTLDYVPQPDPLNENTPSTASITIVPVQRSVTIGPSGMGSSPFEIKGGSKSVFPEDIKVRAQSAQGRVVAEETLTVLQFNVMPVTSGIGHTPLNPSVVTPIDEGSTANLFGSTARPEGLSDQDFTIPGLNNSAKLSPFDIEVLWGREIEGQFLDSDQATGLIFPTDSTDRSKVTQTNLRMQDTSVPQGLGDLTPITYYLGHRTSLNPLLPRLPQNNVGAVNARYRPMLTYPVVLHLLAGPTLDSGLSAGDVTAIMADVDRVWSQAGISFNVVGTYTESLVDDSLLGATTSSIGPAGVGDAGTISLIRRDGQTGTRAIDIYFVKFLYDSSTAGPNEPQLNGLTLTRTFGLFTGSPGVLIAGPNNVGQNSRTIQSITRTIAHELGHYLFNSRNPLGDHVSDDRNLMYDSGNDTKRDLTDDQVDSARSSTAPKDVE